MTTVTWKGWWSTVVVLLVILGALVILVALVLVRTLGFKAPVGDSSLAPFDPGTPGSEVLARLSGAIAIPTVSTKDYAATDFAPFDRMAAYLRDAFPLFHEACTLERINTYTLAYRWQGSDPALKPLALIAHYDVVPVEQGTEQDWRYPAFSGTVAEGFVWGRGTLDIKSQMTAHLEAAEALMREGFTPTRDLYFVYGHDEEVGGANGAQKAVEHFAAQGLRFEGVLDEGGLVALNSVKGVDAPLALIGLGEKGRCDYEITVTGSGGHSSMPPAHSSLGKAAELICAIEGAPLPARLTPPVELMLRNIAGEMGFAVRMAMANLWLFRPVLLGILAKNPTTNALIRTTFAATMAKASDASNVLPLSTQVTVNVRLLPGDTVALVREHFEGLAAARGIAVSIRESIPEEASAVSPVNTPLYERLIALTREFYPGAIPTPYLVMGGTDSRKYHVLTNAIYRFTPTQITDVQKATIHGTNESISIENYARMIHFFKRFIKDYDE